MLHVTITGVDRIRRFLDRLTHAAGRALLERVGELVAEQTDRRFDTKRDPEGKHWREWSPAYAATRPPGASLLIDTGALRQLIEQRIAGESVELIAPTPYAGAVQTKRPFLGLGPTDTGELRRAIETHFLEAIRAA